MPADRITLCGRFLKCVINGYKNKEKEKKVNGDDVEEEAITDNRQV